MPVERVREHAAEQHADAAAAGGDEAEDAHRLRALARLGEQVMISDSATAETTAPPSPCTARAPTSIPCVVAEAAGERGQREQRDAGQEQPPVAEEVAEPAAEQQEAAERQQVGVDHPGQRVSEKPRSARIDGSATFTIVVSSTIIRLPRQSTSRASQR